MSGALKIGRAYGLGSAPLVAAAVGFVIILAALAVMSTLVTNLSVTHEKNATPLAQLDAIRALHMDVRCQQWRILFARDRAVTAAGTRRIEERLDTIDGLWGRYYPNGVISPRESELAREIHDLMPEARLNVERFIGLARAGHYDDAQRWTIAHAPDRERLDTLLSTDIQDNIDQARSLWASSRRVFDIAFGLGALLIVCGVGAIGYALTKMMRRRDQAIWDSQFRTWYCEQIIEHTSSAIVITDMTGTILRVNPSFCSVSGYSEEEAVGRNANMWSSGRQPPEFYQKMWGALRDDGAWRGEIWNRRKNGELVLVMLNISAIRGPADTCLGYVSIGTDVTEVRQKEDRLGYIAMHDALTGLPNRTLFGERLSHAVARAHRHRSRLAVMFIDLDGFKSINDNHGHAFGDTVLVAVATRLRGALRESDTVARLSGDEFAVVIEDLRDPRDVGVIAQSLLSAVTLPVEAGEHVAQPSLSIGICVYPDHSTEVECLVALADEAMYRAKKAGKHTYRVHGEAEAVPFAT
ncbi:diguanylate cyclase domain-containing protein [Uliginosibacterium sp. sgz301328]|uniref:diguanylate cyclase domain-containing protein n=1 Tax=Uliginosibacterium sp. sgz301328 TaxID=3243764 RepID=UPI00359EECD4